MQYDLTISSILVIICTEVFSQETGVTRETDVTVLKNSIFWTSYVLTPIGKSTIFIYIGLFMDFTALICYTELKP